MQIRYSKSAVKVINGLDKPTKQRIKSVSKVLQKHRLKVI